MIRHGLEQLKANGKKGVSMALVLCISAFFMAFAAAILYTAGVVTAQSTHRLEEERCYRLAKSYADVLGRELTRYQNKGDTAAAGSFYAFANQFLDGERYLEYNSDYPDTSKYQYVLDTTDLSDITKSGSLPENFGNLRITLSKEKNSSENQTELEGGEIPVQTGSYDAVIAEKQNISVRQYIFTVEVTAYFNDMTYAYSTEYTREEKYNVQFSHNGTTIVWDTDDQVWKVGNTSGNEYSFDKSDLIQYKYLTGSTTSCIFVENADIQEETADAET